MTELRHFQAEDADVLKDNQYAAMPVDKIRGMIGDWNKCEFQGRYFEMFAIIHDGKIEGTISLYHHSESVVSIGPEVFPKFRRRGAGREAMLAAMERARDKGYKIAMQQVKSDNAASIALHKSLGFETDGYRYANRRGNEVLLFVKVL